MNKYLFQILAGTANGDISGGRGQICGIMDKKTPRRAFSGGTGGFGRGTNYLQAILFRIGAIGRIALENRELGRGLVSNPHEFRSVIEFRGTFC